MNDVRYICFDGEAKFAVVPIELWSRTSDLLLSVELTEPDDVRDAIQRGDHPLKAWRQHRRLTTQKLADQIGVSRVYITLIETGKRPGSPEKLHAISRVLSVPVRALTRTRVEAR